MDRLKKQYITDAKDGDGVKTIATSATPKKRGRQPAKKAGADAKTAVDEAEAEAKSSTEVCLFSSPALRGGRLIGDSRRKRRQRRSVVVRLLRRPSMRTPAKLRLRLKLRRAPRYSFTVTTLASPY